MREKEFQIQGSVYQILSTYINVASTRAVAREFKDHIVLIIFGRGPVQSLQNALTLIDHGIFAPLTARQFGA